MAEKKFKSGDMVMFKNGKGDCYQLDVRPADRYNPEYYYLDNGSVHIGKRARSGLWTIAEVDRRFKKVG